MKRRKKPKKQISFSKKLSILQPPKYTGEEKKRKGREKGAYNQNES